MRGFKGIVATTAFLIEGRDEDELPERMLGLHCNTRVEMAKVSIEYDYTPPPPMLKKKRSSWFGSMFGTGSKIEETKQDRDNVKQNSSIEENVEPNTRGG
mmetsp:Transcript_18872/g.36195  ORF Transcript_18872/g.36195 Transcript_18872/m.36195 type:complete len:100 (-) Transcript_18872:256-555(-)